MFIKDKSTIFIIILAFVLIAGGVWFTQKLTPTTPPVVSDKGEQAVDKTENGLSGSEVDTSAWKIYRNEKYGFEFRYPKNWDLDDTQNNNEIVSVSNYFTNKYNDQNGSKVLIIIEKNKHNSFDEWTKQNFNVFENETIEKNTNLDFQGLKANLIKSTNPIAGGYNDRLAVFNQKKNLIYAIWSYRGIMSELKNENEAHEKVIDQIVNSFKIANKINFCSQEPIPTEIGRDIYPTNIEKYGNIGYLGELFTAVDCGPERVSKIFGVDVDNFTLWPDIGLKDPPSKELLIVLQEIGFERGSTCSADQPACTHWTLYKTVPIDSILRLKNFADEIQSSGCVNCG